MCFIVDHSFLSVVMKQYQLGPNGGIVTSLNLFATKFDQVLKLVGGKKNEFVIIDTPGQIEVKNT